MPLRMFGWHPRLASLPAEARASPLPHGPTSTIVAAIASSAL